MTVPLDGQLHCYRTTAGPTCRPSPYRSPSLGDTNADRPPLPAHMQGRYCCHSLALRAASMSQQVPAASWRGMLRSGWGVQSPGCPGPFLTFGGAEHHAGAGGDELVADGVLLGLLEG